jgi:hypothetical protein
MLYRRGKFWRYQFQFDGELIRETTKSTSKTLAKQAESSVGANLTKITTA